MDINTTLSERGARYGDFAVHAAVAQGLQSVMRSSGNWDSLIASQAQALTVIADKIARILTGDPDYADNWHDIQGYAKLVEDRLVPDSEPAIHDATAVDWAKKPSWDEAPEWAESLAWYIGTGGTWEWLSTQASPELVYSESRHYQVEDPSAGNVTWSRAPVWAQWLFCTKTGLLYWASCEPMASATTPGGWALHGGYSQPCGAVETGQRTSWAVSRPVKA